jgi:hypothetical protein
MSWYTIAAGLVFVALAVAALPVSRYRVAALCACQRLLELTLAAAILGCAVGHFAPRLIAPHFKDDVGATFDRLDAQVPGFRIAHQLGWDWLVLAVVALIVILPHICFLQKARRALRAATEPAETPEPKPATGEPPRLLKDMF